MNNKKILICVAAGVSAIVLAIIVISIVLMLGKSPKEVEGESIIPDITLENGVEIVVESDEETEESSTIEIENSSSITVIALDDDFLSQY